MIKYFQIATNRWCIVFFSIACLVFFEPICAKICSAFEDDVDDSFSERESMEFSYYGFVEFENFMNTYDKQETKDANVKNEIRSNLHVRCGIENIYIYSTMNLYIVSSLFSDELSQDYFYSKETDITDSLRISSEEMELIFNELYINYGSEKFRLRLGNQLYGWGTADLQNPTSYFNPMDMRELLFKSEDELKVGIPSVSGMMFFQAYTLEVVVVPFHVPSALPPKKSYWDIEILDTGMGIVVGEYVPLEKELKNAGAGARLSTSLDGMDISLSCYHGPDMDMLVVPKNSDFDEPKPGEESPEVYIWVEPEYHVVNSFGIDFSKNFDALVIQFEAAFTPDKWGIVEEQISDFSDADEIIKLLPFETKKSQYVSFSLGFNYFIPIENFIENYNGNTIFTMEASFANYTDSELLPPFLGNILAMRLDGTYFEDKIGLSLTGIYELMSKGFVIWPGITYDFQNGFTVELEYVDISGVRRSGVEMDNLLYNFKDKDIVMLRLRYEF